MGTTRLGTDSRTSVVDADCRVHGMDNLYVAGSSVFPTGGWANPTLTIIAPSMRLGDHLRRRLQDKNAATFTSPLRQISISSNIFKALMTPKM